MLLLTMLLATADAKDLNGRLGVGFNQSIGFTQSSATVTALSVRYGIPTGTPTINFQIEANAGLDYSSTGTRANGGLRLQYGVVAEDNLNLYLGAGVGYLFDNYTPGASAVRVQPSLEAEFFPFGLENLGFTAGVGVNVDIGSGVRIGTVGGAPNVGMHYYF